MIVGYGSPDVPSIEELTVLPGHDQDGVIGQPVSCWALARPRHLTRTGQMSAG